MLRSFALLERSKVEPLRLPALFALDRRSDAALSSARYRASSSISLAVALALPTTPGIPAPGCVPAPTKYRLGI